MSFGVLPQVYISHSSRDLELVESLVALLRAALNLRPEDIRCTSLERLSLG